MHINEFPTFFLYERFSAFSLKWYFSADVKAKKIPFVPSSFDGCISFPSLRRFSLKLSLSPPPLRFLSHQSDQVYLSFLCAAQQKTYKWFFNAKSYSSNFTWMQQIKAKSVFIFNFPLPLSAIPPNGKCSCTVDWLFRWFDLAISIPP